MDDIRTDTRPMDAARVAVIRERIASGYYDEPRARDLTARAILATGALGTA